jgi:ATP-binding cassette, subfamily B, bacterial PglK
MVGVLLAAILEMIGIASIPAFATLLVDPERAVRVLSTYWPSGLPLPEKHESLVMACAFLLAGFFLLKNLTIAAILYYEARLLRNINASISARLFLGYLKSPYLFHLKRSSAIIVRNLTESVNHTVDVFRSLVLLSRELLVLAVIMAVLFFVDPTVSVLVIALIGGSASLFYFVVRRSLAERGQLVQMFYGRQLREINHGLGALKESKIVGNEAQVVQRFAEATQGVWRHEYYQRVVSALPRLFLEVVAVLALVVIATLFIVLGRPLEAIIPTLALLAVAVVRLIPGVNAIVSSITGVRYYLPAVENIVNEIDILEASLAVGALQGRERVGRLKHDIKFDRVTFQYPDKEHPVLCGICLTVCQGEFVGLTGATGSGKSTFLDLFMGLLGPTDGRVLVDGVDIHVDPQGWQRQIGYVPQEIYLLDETIRRNIAFGQPDAEVDDSAIERACHLAQLDALIDSLPLGLDTVVGDRGIGLSGGQRQRVGIARAMYGDPEVLVLDEATSALDQETERAFLHNLRVDCPEITVILVTHRDSALEACDRILKVSNGAVHEVVPDGG